MAFLFRFREIFKKDVRLGRGIYQSSILGKMQNFIYGSCHSRSHITIAYINT